MSAPAKSSFLRTVKAVAWSFVGIRKRSGFEDDLAKISPLHVIAVGLVAVLLIVLGLVVFVNWVVAK
ncbi:hypothetical protein J2X19_003933 [Rhodoferax ferrireducens]|uniref:DUF2970 domain-containing protein n=1 Tax=Rhodoferax ferrireducens TaxID=192843 RepID=A0ABU2CD20_9BURK|nr:DUF2970 domain-containing protein [Rhodoferax ferrireducens]MDR7379239.1 hypothetical protein [Rhodoferax ferrireducens]